MARINKRFLLKDVESLCVRHGIKLFSFSYATEDQETGEAHGSSVAGNSLNLPSKMMDDLNSTQADSFAKWMSESGVMGSVAYITYGSDDAIAEK